jgi:putative ABC transport system permease protein
MGIPLLEGRPLEASDVSGRAHAVVVSRTFVERYLPDGMPLGRRILMPWGDTLVGTIVGVVGDVKHTGVDSAANPATYWAAAQFPWSSMTLVIRSEADPALLAAGLAAQVHALDPQLALAEVRPLEAYLGDVLARRRLSLILVAGFAALALALTAVGLYGVMAYTVVQRTREFGIRVALGANAASVLRGVLGRGLALVAIGIAVGVVGAIAFTRLLGALLYGVRPTDPAVFAVIIALLAVVGLVASYLPARRATRVDPMIALRSE